MFILFVFCDEKLEFFHHFRVKPFFSTLFVFSCSLLVLTKESFHVSDNACASLADANIKIQTPITNENNNDFFIFFLLLFYDKTIVKQPITLYLPVFVPEDGKTSKKSVSQFRGKKGVLWDNGIAKKNRHPKETPMEIIPETRKNVIEKHDEGQGNCVLCLDNRKDILIRRNCWVSYTPKNALAFFVVVVQPFLIHQANKFAQNWNSVRPICAFYKTNVHDAIAL